MSIIKIKNVHKTFDMGKEHVHVIKGVDLEIKKGEIVCFLGKSGSGKSTLLNLMAGLERPSSGEIVIQERPIHRLSEDALAKFRQKHVGFVFQAYNLLPMLTSLENVALPLIFKKESVSERNRLAKKMLDSVDLSDRTGHKPSEMSGGQQQRVSIARAFVTNPPIIFADEPTGNLDTKTTTIVLDLITGLVKKNNQTLIMVTHDEETTKYADKVVYLSDGKIDRIEEKKSNE